MCINKNILKRSYIIALILALFISFIPETQSLAFVPGFSILKYLFYFMCCLIFFVKILFDRHSIYSLICILAFIVCSIIVGFFSAKYLVPLIIIAILSAKNVSYLSIVKCFYITIGSLTLMVVILSLLGLTPNIQSYKDNILRNSFGFNYPLALSSFVLGTCIAFCIYHYKHISWKFIIILSVILYTVYSFTAAQMNFYASIVLIFILIISKMNNHIVNSFPLNLSWMSLPLMTGITFYLAICYQPLNDFYISLNKMLSGRISLSNYSINHFHIPIFGQFIKENPTGSNIGDIQTDFSNYFYIDQSMVKILLEFGIIIFVFILIFYTYRMYQLHLKKLNFIVLLFLIVVICAFSDDKFFELCYNPFLLILFSDTSGFCKV